MRYLIICFVFILLTNLAFPYMKTPNIHVSPGSLCTVQDPDFYEFRYSENIPYCKRNVSTKIKKEVCKRDGVLDRRDYTVDHIYPLSLGGSNKKDNLWCQHKNIYTGHIEYQLYRAVSNSEMTVKQALDQIHKIKFGF